MKPNETVKRVYHSTIKVDYVVVSKGNGTMQRTASAKEIKEYQENSKEKSA